MEVPKAELNCYKNSSYKRLGRVIIQFPHAKASQAVQC
jgi:hypothetical protein